MAKGNAWNFTVRAPKELRKVVKAQLRPLDGWRLNQWMVKAIKNEIERNTTVGA